MREYTTLIARLERSMGTTSSQNLLDTSCVLHLLLTKTYYNYGNSKSNRQTRNRARVGYSHREMCRVLLSRIDGWQDSLLPS